MRIFRIALVVATVATLSLVEVASAEPSSTGVRALQGGYLDAGGYHTCAVLASGGARCWGRNVTGELGDGTQTSSSTPVSVLISGRRLTAIAAGGGFSGGNTEGHTCALLADATVQCWGNNASGQLGDGTNTNSSVPVQTKLSETIFFRGRPAGFFRRRAVAISAGRSHSCAILDTGRAVCWGDNSSGQLGNGTTTNASTPVGVRLPTEARAIAISAGQNRTCAVLDTGSVLCWGANGFGELGDGSTIERHSPAAVLLPFPHRATAIVSKGNDATCAILDDRSVVCWGYNGYFAFPLGIRDAAFEGIHPVPVQVTSPGGADTTAIASAANSSCTIAGDGSVTCWGDDNLFTGPATLPADRQAIAISGGRTHMCALLDDGSVICWSGNYESQQRIRDPKQPVLPPASVSTGRRRLIGPRVLA